MFENMKMAQTIEAILAAGGYNLATMEDGQSVRIKHAGYMDLVISRISASVVHVEHGFVQNGDWMQDPGIRFFTGYRELARAEAAGLLAHLPGWIPMDITQDPVGVYRECTWLEHHADARWNTVARFDLRAQDEIGAFGEMWARNLCAQGWIKPHGLTFPRRAA